MRAKKVDTTHGAIRDALRKAGIRVFDCSATGRGFPDLACSYRGFVAFVEAKSGKHGLNEMQRDFIRDWEGPVIVTNDPEEAVAKFFHGYSAGLINWMGR